MLIVPPFLSGARADASLPPRWRRTMTNDPVTNYQLGKFATPLPNPLEEAARILVLVRVLGQTCAGATVDEAALKAQIRRSGLDAVSAQKLAEISARVDAAFAGFDYETLAHLCAGIDHLFGPDGVLGRSLMKPGAGEPKLPFDPRNPYLRIKPLVEEEG